MVLVVQSFGKEYEFRRAIFAILSYYAASPSFEWKTTYVFTDTPDYFQKYLTDLPVEYIELTPEKIRQMRGEIDFLHRMKIALIEESFVRSNSAIFYLDSDTFFVSDPGSVFKAVESGGVFMHLPEYEFATLAKMKMPAAKPFHAFLEFIRGKTFRLRSGSVIVHEHEYSWNAGVMGLPLKVHAMLTDVYALTEQFYPATENHASEQYAFSIVLQKSFALQRCDDVVYHYWYRVKKQIMDQTLGTLLSPAFADCPLSERLKLIAEAVKDMPALLETHVLTLRDNSIQSFHENKFSKGYEYAFRALVKDVSAFGFLRDVLYHTKRLILGRA